MAISYSDVSRPQDKRNLLVSKAWIQAVAVVVLFGFFVLGFLAYKTYSDEAPIPKQVLNAAGNVLFTGSDITAGQQVFLRNGLMEYGSIFGHGAYLGPDYTADYLRRAATSVATSHVGGNGRKLLWNSRRTATTPQPETWSSRKLSRLRTTSWRVITANSFPSQVHGLAFDRMPSEMPPS